MFRALITFAIAVLLVAPLLGQDVPKAPDKDPKLVESFDPRRDCESLEGGLDRLFADASNTSSRMAYLVIHQGKNPYDNVIVYRKAIRYRAFRGFPVEQFSVVTATGDVDIRVETWISNGKKPPVDSSDLDKSLPKNSRRVSLATDDIEIFHDDGRSTFGGSGNPSCLYTFSPSVTFEVLEANPGFDAEFVIKAKSPRSFRKIVGIFRQELVEGTPYRARVRFVNGGREKDFLGIGGEAASVKTSLVRNLRK